MTHVEFASDVVHLHNIEWWKNSPYNTKLGSNIYWLDDSTGLEVSTLASSTLDMTNL